MGSHACQLVDPALPAAGTAPSPGMTPPSHTPLVKVSWHSQVTSRLSALASAKAALRREKLSGVEKLLILVTGSVVDSVNIRASWMVYPADVCHIPYLHAVSTGRCEGSTLQGESLGSCITADLVTKTVVDGMNTCASWMVSPATTMVRHDVRFCQANSRRGTFLQTPHWTY